MFHNMTSRIHTFTPLGRVVKGGRKRDPLRAHPEPRKIGPKAELIPYFVSFQIAVPANKGKNCHLLCDVFEQYQNH